jgi:predicted TIM-barrel fold metal-dependent hydrolase
VETLQQQQRDGGVTRRRAGIVDVDVHPVPRSVDEIRRYMPMPWRERYQGERRAFFNNPVHGSRLDSTPPDGGPKGSDPEFLRAQLIDAYGVAYAILISRTFCNIHPDPDYAAAIAAAFNQWLTETWLEEHNHDGAFKGSITVAQQDPHRAAAEIDRWAEHKHMVQVTMDSGARAPFGQRMYYPIYEACERHGLPLAIHPGTEGMGINHQPTPGYPTHYIEWHCAMSLSFQAHLISLITEGVFERFPGLRIVLVEGGVAWLAPLMWRLDAYWKSLRSEVPWVRKAPSEYLRDHVRLGTQPLERPADDRQLLQLLEMMDAEHLVMFSSDYPHWDFDSPARAFPTLPTRLRDAIFSDNARAFYGLDV